MPKHLTATRGHCEEAGRWLNPSATPLRITIKNGYLVALDVQHPDYYYRLPNPYAETPHHHCNSLPRHLTTYAEAGRLPNPYAGRLPITAQHLLRIRCNSCC
jgi:hypothetical protein